MSNLKRKDVKGFIEILLDREVTSDEDFEFVEKIFNSVYTCANEHISPEGFLAYAHNAAAIHASGIKVDDISSNEIAYLKTL